MTVVDLIKFYPICTYQIEMYSVHVARLKEDDDIDVTLNLHHMSDDIVNVEYLISFREGEMEKSIDGMLLNFTNTKDALNAARETISKYLDEIYSNSNFN